MLARGVLVLVGALLVGGGLAGIIAALRQGRRALGVAGWPTTAGVVITSRVTLGRLDRAARFPLPVYRARVVYRYAVGGRRYSARMVRWPDPLVGATRAEAARVAARYPVGTTVAVRHDPRRPRLAALELGVAWGVLAGRLALGLLGLLLGLGALGALPGGWGR